MTISLSHSAAVTYRISRAVVAYLFFFLPPFVAAFWPRPIDGVVLLGLLQSYALESHEGPVFLKIVKSSGRKQYYLKHSFGAVATNLLQGQKAVVNKDSAGG